MVGSKAGKIQAGAEGSRGFGIAGLGLMVRGFGVFTVSGFSFVFSDRFLFRVRRIWSAKVFEGRGSKV